MYDIIPLYIIKIRGIQMADITSNEKVQSGITLNKKTVLLICILLAAIMAFAGVLTQVMPRGVYEYDEAGNIINGTYTPIDEKMNIYDAFRENHSDADVIITDECQFFTKEQIDELRLIANDFDVPVLCFGLRTDFLTNLFPGSHRLFEIADSISEIKTMCECGRKATVNARINRNGRIVTRGNQVLLGGNDKYIAMCHKCWLERIRSEAKK